MTRRLVRTAKQIEVSCENFDCTKPESMTFTPSEFAEWFVELEEEEFTCQRCHEALSVSGLTLTCYICGAHIDFDGLAGAWRVLEDRCPYCAGAPHWDVEFYSVVVAESWSDYYGTYDWTATGKRAEELERKSRTDYWEGLIHFCNAEQFISIYKERRIVASSTGLYGKRNPSHTKAVCLTEATEPNWDELKEVHGDYGYIFRKRDIIGLDGAPTIYLPQSVIDLLKTRHETIPQTLWPYLSKLAIPSHSSGRKHDFLHEREWRVPGDIDFSVVRPYAVTFQKRRPKIKDEELILVAAREFQALTKSRTLETLAHDSE